MFFNNPYDICDFFIEKAVKEGDAVIDATVGNGKDTKKLSDAVGETGRVYGFDIQAKAIETAREQRYTYNNVDFFNASHAELDGYVHEEVSMVMFNLGYLPGGDHGIITKAGSTIAAMEKSMKLLKREGIILLVIYRGGDTGFAESEAVTDYIKKIDYRKFNVLHFDYVNRPNNPPSVAVIQKK